jgi:predicted nucleic acid-binding protein
VYDALFVALAEEKNGQLISADKKVQSVAKKLLLNPSMPR